MPQNFPLVLVEQQAAPAELSAAELSAAEPLDAEFPLLETIIGTRPTARRRRREIVVPEGYRLFPAGIKRRIRVNRDFFSLASGKPLILHSVTKNVTRLCSDIQVKGAIKLVASQEAVGCSLRRSVYIETSAPLLVKE